MNALFVCIFVDKYVICNSSTNLRSRLNMGGHDPTGHRRQHELRKIRLLLLLHELSQSILRGGQALNSVLHSSAAQHKSSSHLSDLLDEHFIVAGLLGGTILEELDSVLVDVGVEHSGIPPVPGNSHGAGDISLLVQELQVANRVIDGSKGLVVVTSDTNTLEDIALVIGGDLEVELLLLKRFERVDLVVDGLVLQGTEVLHNSGGSEDVGPGVSSGESLLESFGVLLLDELGVVFSGNETGVVQQGPQEVDVVLQPTDLVGIQSGLHTIHGLGTVLTPSDQLGDHGIVVHANFGTLTDTRVAPDGLLVVELRVVLQVGAGLFVVGKETGGGEETTEGILGVDTRFESPTIRLDVWKKKKKRGG